MKYESEQYNYTGNESDGSLLDALYLQAAIIVGKAPSAARSLND